MVRTGQETFKSSDIMGSVHVVISERYEMHKMKRNQIDEEKPPVTAQQTAELDEDWPTIGISL